MNSCNLTIIKKSLSPSSPSSITVHIGHIPSSKLPPTSETGKMPFLSAPASFGSYNVELYITSSIFQKKKNVKLYVVLDMLDEYLQMLIIPIPVTTVPRIKHIFLQINN